MRARPYFAFAALSLPLPFPCPLREAVGLRLYSKLLLPSRLEKVREVCQLYLGQAVNALHWRTYHVLWNVASSWRPLSLSNQSAVLFAASVLWELGCGIVTYCPG